MDNGVEVLRYTAFSDDPSGGNPAGVVLDANGLDDATLLRIAHDVGYSETAFLWPLPRPGDYTIRYFSPVAEVPFCGHATIASAVALADQGAGGELRFQTPAGEVAVRVHADGSRRTVATLTSVTPSVSETPAAIVAEALAALGWQEDDIDPQLPPRIAFAGAHHLVFGVRSRELLSRLSYDFERLRQLMTAEDWTTIQLVWREGPAIFHSRVPFPVGGVVEDPATGAAAAALGAYLRELGAVQPPATITIHQGDDMGRPSLIAVEIDPGSGGIRVAGTAVPIPA
ncbi:MAG: PhzF family phenazine biosynthesis isomerase [Candidatus Dormibacteraeota bacterium]|uniref:Phenazine biosynthesis protein PhzF n=1 Tax=Candidatus Aeolococcus gillhamiae TaxID=3127015 RepID=A0A2W6AFG8_9BACT|nr:PhzF family phenazine biosynthesis isomerase [Candidatus Dormibacteraeota bacterium]PZR82204.1 MAG: phenazine biosynthesis protein PhzF [Candidatus Dormibacter sp. RRmetagenome_bin12]